MRAIEDKSLENKKEIENLKNKSSQPISFNPTIIFDGKIIGRYDQKLKVVYFGTKYGDLQVNLKNSETTTQDIQNWIIKTNLQSAP
ncbi:MAG: hypothetical protein OXE41_02375 [Gammaproteobacteria bacterium]|nr:hypothetical protein [Gammaproteobacteria bacterium]